MDVVKRALVCPICDAELSPRDKVCPSCNTDLALFGLTPEVAPAPQGSPDVVVIGGVVGDKVDALLKEIEASREPPKDAVEGKKAVAVFNCPECGTELPIDATQCSKCGVMFEEEVAAVCPLCDAVIDIDAPKCPSCGAIFEGEAPAPPAQAPEPPEPPPVEQPVPSVEEQHPKPAEPAKGMSFVERMKILRMQHDAVPPPVKPSPPAADVKPPAPPAPTERKTPLIEGPKPSPPGADVKPPAPPAPTERKAAPRVDIPTLVSRIKEDFALARSMNIDIGEARDVINKAVAAGRAKDLGTAFEYMKLGEARVSHAFNSHITARLKDMERQVNAIAEVDAALVQGLLKNLDEVRRAAADGQWADALMVLEDAQEGLKRAASDFIEARKGLEALRGLLEDAKELHLDMGEIRSFYEEGTKALTRRDWDTAKMFVEQAQEKLGKTLPGFIAAEMRKAKTKLMEVKMMNLDVAEPVRHLMEANRTIKDEKYAETLHHIRLFKDAMTALSSR